MLARKIKKYLKTHGITQKELAEAIGMTPSCLCMMLNGRVKMSVERYMEICAFLGISPGEFMENDVEKKDQPETEKGR